MPELPRAPGQDRPEKKKSGGGSMMNAPHPGDDYIDPPGDVLEKYGADYEYRDGAWLVHPKDGGKPYMLFSKGDHVEWSPVGSQKRYKARDTAHFLAEYADY